jgi:uncharacterized protein (TIGR03437 family)
LPSAAANYSTYIGDSYPYNVTAITLDSAGNTYITGSRQISIPGSFPPTTDIFVSKLDPSGNLTLLTTVAGKASDQANAIAVDSAGNIYVAGYANSPDFPLLHALQTTPASSGATGFLVKLNASGAMLYSTYLGGTRGSSTMTAVAADSGGNAYVTGSTFASDYPSTAGLPAAPATDSPAGPNSVAFFAKISPAGDKLLYAGGLAGLGRECGNGSSCFTSTVASSGAAIAVDPAGNAYIGGNTFGGGLPTTPGVLQPEGIGGFVAKVNASGTGMAYVTLLGTANYAPPPISTNSDPATFVYAIAVDSSGDAYIAGSTADPNFPATASAFQPQLAFTGQASFYDVPPADAFIAKLNPSGTAMVWATFLGGTNQDSATALSLDSAANVWVVGTTRSTDFPQASGFPNGPEFLAELNASGTSLLHSQLFPANTVAAGIAVDASGAVHVAGATGVVSAYAQPSANTAQVFGMANAAFGTLAGRVAPGEVISIYGANLGPAAGVTASFDSAGFLPVLLAGTQVVIDGIPAPLLYVSSTQINAVAPVELTGTSPVSLQVTAASGASPPFRLVIDPAIPEVFRTTAGITAAFNQDSTVNSKSNPAKSGTIVAIWATGVGLPIAGADGQETTVAQQVCNCEVYASLDPGIVDASDQYVPSVYAGPAPGTVTGVVQINFRVTAGESGYYYLIANGKSGDAFFIYVSP